MILKLLLLNHKPNMNNETGSVLIFPHSSVLRSTLISPLQSGYSSSSPSCTMFFQISKPLLPLLSLIGMLSTPDLPDEFYSSFETQLKSKQLGECGWLSRLSIWLQHRSWSHGSWIWALHRALCCHHRASSDPLFPSLSVPPVCSFSLKKK